MFNMRFMLLFICSEYLVFPFFLFFGSLDFSFVFKLKEVKGGSGNVQCFVPCTVVFQLSSVYH